jgi:glycosyltransferase involved in cell wall biosynthesis
VFAEEVCEATDICSDDPLSILYVGGLSRPKGVDVLIRSFADLQSATEREVTLTIRGTGGDESELRQLVAEEGVTNLVEFVPYLQYDELLELYRDADIFVLPSRQEGQGRVLVEALASGCAVVATDVGGIPYIIRHQENGLLVKPGDESSLSHSLKRLIKDNDLRAELARGGLSWAQKNTLELQTEDLLEKIQAIYE